MIRDPRARKRIRAVQGQPGVQVLGIPWAYELCTLTGRFTAATCSQGFALVLDLGDMDSCGNLPRDKEGSHHNALLSARGWDTRHSQLAGIHSLTGHT